MSEQKAKDKVIEKFLATREVRMTSRIGDHIKYTGVRTLKFGVAGHAIERLEAIVTQPLTVRGRDVWGLRYYDEPDLPKMEVACLEKGDKIQVRLAC